MPDMGKSKVLYISTGLVVVLFGLATIFLGTPPKSTDSGTIVAAWFVEHASDVRWSTWFGTLSGVAFAVFAVQVRRRLPAPYRDVFYFGAVALAIETVLQSWFIVGMALHPRTLDPSTARTLLDISSFWGPLLTSSTMLMFGSFTLAVVRKVGVAGVPRWVGYLTAVVFAEQLVETITIFGSRGFIAPGGPMNVVLGAGLSIIAFVCIAVALAKAPER